MLLIYDRDNHQLVNANLIVDAVVARREADSIIDAEAKTVANLAVGRHRVSPKKAERLGNKIYFNVSFNFFKSILTAYFYRLYVRIAKLMVCR